MKESGVGNQRLRRGVAVFVGLLVLSFLEYAIAVSSLPGILLLVVALAKAALILVYFMHVRDIAHLDEEGTH